MGLATVLDLTRVGLVPDCRTGKAPKPADLNQHAGLSRLVASVGLLSESALLPLGGIDELFHNPCVRRIIAFPGSFPALSVIEKWW